MSLTVDDLVDATPDTRDRAVDFLRAFSIVVVVLWHWMFSVTHWNGAGALTMPNPIGDVPALWFLTWVLQVMPLFFFVGGFANFVAWTANERRGGTARTFLANRLRRLLAPIGGFALVWIAFECVAHALVPGYRGVLHWGFVVFVPLWFLGVYTFVVLCAPVTVRWHRRAPLRSLLLMGAAVACVDVLRFHTGIDAIGFANVACVFAFVHQLGYFYGDGTLTRAPRRMHVAMVAVSAAALVPLTVCGPYPISMVTIASEAGSNMLPTTACIALLGVFQAGLALLARPYLNRLLARRRIWKLVVIANAFAMTVFTWHMTAYVIAVGVLHGFGVGLGGTANAAWWLARPLWLVAPGLVLVGVCRASRAHRPGRYATHGFATRSATRR